MQRLKSKDSGTDLSYCKIESKHSVSQVYLLVWSEMYFTTFIKF
jgi:hypothetical protein